MAHRETPGIYSIAKYPRTRLGDANRPPQGAVHPTLVRDLATALGAKLRRRSPDNIVPDGTPVVP